MQPAALMHLVTGCLLLGSLLLALARAGASAPGSLRLVAPNLWVLQHLCRSTGEMLRSGPVPRELVIDLSGILVIDEASLALLGAACGQCRAERVHVRIEGCSADVAAAIRRRGLRVELQCSAETTAELQAATPHC